MCNFNSVNPILAIGGVNFTMRRNRFISTAAKALALLLAIGVLIHYRHANPPPPAPVGGGDNDEDDVKYSPVVPVSVGQVTRATLHEYVSGYGTVEAAPAIGKNPAASAAIRLPAPALVSQVQCTEGQRVKKGELLFTLDDRYAQAAIARAKAALKSDEQILAQAQKTEGASPLPRQWLLRAERERDLAKNELQAAEAQLQLLDIVSPIDGVVAELLIRPGEVADPSSDAALIVDMDRLIIAANLPGSLLQRVKPGQSARAVSNDLGADRSPADDEESATQPATNSAKVVFVDPIVDPQTGLGIADVSIGPGSGLQLGDFVEVRIAIDVHADCLTVPAVSIVRDSDGNPGICMAVRDFKWAFRHQVKVGLIEAGRVEVAAPGLNAGDWVVTTGAAALPEQARINAVRP